METQFATRIAGPESSPGGQPFESRDSVLVTAAKAGEEWAFVELCKRSSPMVARSIKRFLKNPADIEDALQDCFLQAYKNLGKFEQKSAFSTWLTRVGINCALSTLRKRNKYREESFWEYSAENEPWQEFAVPDNGPLPDERFLRSEEILQLESAIRSLPTSLRTVIELRRFGVSQQEMSDLLNISIPAIKARLVRARNYLRRMYEERSRDTRPKARRYRINLCAANVTMKQ